MGAQGRHHERVRQGDRRSLRHVDDELLVRPLRRGLRLVHRGRRLRGAEVHGRQPRDRQAELHPPEVLPQAGNVRLQGRSVPVLPRHHHHEPQHAVGVRGGLQRRPSRRCRAHLRGRGRAAHQGRRRRGGRLRQDEGRLPQGERQSHRAVLWRLRREHRDAPLLRAVDRRVHGRRG